MSTREGSAREIKRDRGNKRAKESVPDVIEGGERRGGKGAQVNVDEGDG